MNAEMEREMLLHPELSMQTRIAYASSERQCAQIDSFIEEKIDLLIVSPNEGEEVTPAVSRAYKAGIPVIVADRRVAGEDWTAFVGGDNYHVGTLMAEWLRKVQAETKHPLRVLEVCGRPGSVPEMLRHQGLTEAVSGQPLTISSVDGSEDAYRAVEAYLGSHGGVDAIVAQNDRMAIEASRAVRDAGLKHVRIMGVDGIYDGLQAIVDGVIECTATYPSRGDLLIATAARILAGEPYVRDTVLASQMVDALTAQALLTQYNERNHDLEIIRLIKLSEVRSQESALSSQRLLTAAVIASALLLVAFVIVMYMQLRMQSKIKQDVLPQLENVREAIALSRRDEAFAEQVRQLIDDNLTNPDLNMDLLSNALQLSRTQVFRRVKKVTGSAPADYIRERKLIRAEQMLKTTDKTIREVAFELGFAKPGYFSKCYKDYFGYLPSER